MMVKWTLIVPRSKKTYFSNSTYIATLITFISFKSIQNSTYFGSNWIHEILSYELNLYKNYIFFVLHTKKWKIIKQTIILLIVLF